MGTILLGRDDKKQREFGAANGTTIDAPQIPIDEPVPIQTDLKGFQHLVPGAVFTPAVVAVVDALPGTVAFRYVSPRRTDSETPEHPIE